MIKIPYRQRELAESDIRFYKQLDAEFDEYFKNEGKTKTFILIWLGLVLFYVFARGTFIYTTELILTLGILSIFQFFSLRTNANRVLRQKSEIAESFKKKYGSYPFETGKEYTFEDDEYVPWEFVKFERLLETKIENTDIRLTLDPDNRGLRYVISGNLSQGLYSKPNHMINYAVLGGFKKFQIQELRDLFKRPLEFTMTPHLIEAFLNDHELTFSKWVYSEEPEEFEHEEEPTRQTQERTIIHAKWEIDGGAEDQIVSIKQRVDGTWCLHESNSGPKSVQSFGKDENEYWIDIKEENLIDLLQISFQISFDPQREEPLTIQKLEKILKDKGVPHETGVW